VSELASFDTELTVLWSEFEELGMVMGHGVLYERLRLWLVIRLWGLHYGRSAPA
jgi:hypothetical protein